MSSNISEEKKEELRFKRRMRKRKKRKALIYTGNITLYTDIKKDNIGDTKESALSCQNHLGIGSENE